MRNLHFFIYNLLIFLLFAVYQLTSTEIVRASTQQYYPIGTVAAVQGDVFYTTRTPKTAIKVEDPVYMNTVIETGRNSRVLILFIDDSKITLGDNSSLTIDEYVFDPYDATENKGAFSFGKGTFMWISGMLSKKDEPDVRLNTGYGSIGIRGTTVWGGTLDQKYGVYVDKGFVHFQGKWGAGDIGANEGIFVSDDKILRDVASWQQQMIDRTFESVAFAPAAASKLDKKVKELKTANIRKRNDYRGQMFPYKASPFYQGKQKVEHDYFSEEFEQLRNR